MSEPSAAAAVAPRQGFLAAQIAGLEPFDFLVVVFGTAPPDAIEVARGEGGELTVEVAGRPPEAPFAPRQLAALSGAGLVGGSGQAPWRAQPSGAETAAALVDRVLREVLGADPGAPVDVRHGSHRAEHEASQKLALMRDHIEPILLGMLGQPPPRDADGDYVFEVNGVQLYVAPRAAPNAPPIIRVFAITNVGVTLTPELGLFLSRLNFGLAFGRFALDVEHQAVWFDETLLGEHVNDQELRFTIGIVAETADTWDDRIAQMFGGVTRRAMLAEPASSEAPSVKPGQGGYL